MKSAQRFHATPGAAKATQGARPRCVGSASVARFGSGQERLAESGTARALLRAGAAGAILSPRPLLALLGSCTPASMALTLGSLACCSLRALAPQPLPARHVLRRSTVRPTRASLVCSAGAGDASCEVRVCALSARAWRGVRCARAHVQRLPDALACRARLQAELAAAKDRAAAHHSEMDHLRTDLAAALDNVTAARAAAASLDAQRAAAVKSVSRALADKRNAEMAHAEQREALEARVAELEARLAELQQK